MSPIVSVKLSEAVKFLLAYKILTATNKFWKKTAKILYFSNTYSSWIRN